MRICGDEKLSMCGRAAAAAAASAVGRTNGERRSTIDFMERIMKIRESKQASKQARE